MGLYATTSEHPEQDIYEGHVQRERDDLGPPARRVGKEATVMAHKPPFLRDCEEPGSMRNSAAQFLAVDSNEPLDCLRQAPDCQLHMVQGH